MRARNRHTITLRYTRVNLSDLVDAASAGEKYSINERCSPVAYLRDINPRAGNKERRLGFLAGRFQVPDDFDRMGGIEIEAIFHGRS